ncbi:ancient ubiquitous protein 1-like isoform X1 [Cimex lectularius]|uniref:Lipid droplet-regulating VLDL assembly factor AUP1 n=2 Tax=Cimex lectularius TaxID=79782 RepID=A0A8I6RHC3_CIMLE|nr:ancient ubiquitous protein 1-like isoform X1 [Cimex lectularius]XP_014242080.1 ancient ubiquitous protein 1-like isoform X1 [Cimex lectularius]
MAIGANLQLKDVFEKERFPKSNWQFILLVVYFPFGLVIFVLRFFICLHTCLVGLLLTHTPLIRSCVLRMLCLVLGVNVEQDNKKERDKSAKVIVSNCVTRFDHIAFHLLTGCVTHTKWEGFLPVSIIPGLHDFSHDGNNLIQSLRAQIDKDDRPVLIQPEETTSGKECLLKFKTTAAQLCNRVQPVAVFTERSIWANTAPTVLGSSAFLDFFWFLFSPHTVFKIKYLDVLTRKPDETDDAFTERMRTQIATALSYKTAPYTASDKAEYEKRYLDELNQRVLVLPPFANVRQPSPELLRMATQVSEVLPNVPRDVILRDLGRTRSVDVTISNILEGVVTFTPLTHGHSSTVVHRPPTTPSPASGTSGRMSDSIFSRSSQDRMASFMERKAKMIEAARRRYIEKKGLQGLIDNSSVTSTQH